MMNAQLFPSISQQITYPSRQNPINNTKRLMMMII
jgi:hypothetical protein